MDSCVHLAATGFDALPFALVALALFVGGAITVTIVARRRRGWLAALALGALLVTGAGFTSATPAQAAHCDPVPVTAIDDAEVIVEDGLGASVSGNVLANDTGTGLSVANAGTHVLEYGTLVIAANGDFTYTLDTGDPDVEALDEGETLVETFTVQVKGAAGTATSALRITITGHTDNAPPSAAPDTAAVVEDALPGTASGSVLANDTDPDGDSLTASLTSAAEYGTVTIAADGAFLYTLDNGNATVDALSTGETLDDVVDYEVSDGRGGTATSTLTVTITGATDNRAPVAANDAATATEGVDGGSVSGNILTNDSDPDGDPLSAAVTAAPVHGTLLLTSATGAFTYTMSSETADLLGTGETLTDLITYSISDGRGATAIATLTVTLIGVTPNRPPTGLQDLSGTVTEDVAGTATGDLLVGVVDPDGDALTVTTTSPVYGTLLLDPDGTYSYQLDNTNPAVNALNGGDTLQDVITYTVSDGRGGTASATLTITIDGSNDAPVAVTDVNALLTGTLLTGVTGNLLANDIDVDSDMLIVVASVPAGPVYGTLTFYPDGDYLFQVDLSNPAVSGLLAGNTLTSAYTYTVTDAEGASATGSLVITIHGPGAVAPTALDDANTVKEDATPNSVIGNVLANDSDANGDTLSVIDPGTRSGSYGTLILHASGTYTYTLDNTNSAVNALNNGDTLVDPFTYTISDGRGGLDSATLTITIDGTTDNRPPVVSTDTATIREDATPNTVIGNVLSNDSDPDGNTLSVVNAGTITLQYGSLDIHADGSYTYTLDNSDSAVNALTTGQHLTDTFTYTASDGRGGTASTTLSIRIDGSTDNDPPVATADSNTVREDATPNTATGNVLSNDSDPDGDSLSVVNAGLVALPYGSLQINADGSYTYTLDNSNSAANALNNGQNLTDTFTYTVSDGRGGTTSSTLTITINGATDNSPPDVTADSNTVTEDATPNTAIGNVLSNDSDPDGNPLSVVNAGTITLQYGSLDIHADGSYTYTLDNSDSAVNALNTGQHLTDTFTYTASDGRGGTASSTLTITINGATDAVNRAPSATGDSNLVTATSLTGVSGNVLTNDTDPDSDSLTLTNPGSYALDLGQLIIGVNGVYLYSPDTSNSSLIALPNGSTRGDVFNYTISDGRGGTSGAQLFITIIGVNEAPVATNDSVPNHPNTTSIVSGNLLTNDYDVDSGDSITAVAVSSLALQYGSLTIQSNGNYSFALNYASGVGGLDPGETLVQTYVYTINDTYGGTATATLSITIVGAA